MGGSQENYKKNQELNSRRSCRWGEETVFLSGVLKTENLKFSCFSYFFQTKNILYFLKKPLAQKPMVFWWNELIFNTIITYDFLIFLWLPRHVARGSIFHTFRFRITLSRQPNLCFKAQLLICKCFFEENQEKCW